MSYLSRIPADVGKPLDEEPAKGAKGAFDPFDGSQSVRFQGLPDNIINGLTCLDGMARPRLQRTENWEPVLADVRRLVGDGWAAQALNLGWSALDIFGAVSDALSDPNADGLVVKLNGRKVLALCASFATVAQPDGGRAFIYRDSTEGAVLLWDLGKRRAA